LRHADSKKRTAETVCAITSLTAIQAQPAKLAAIIRGHWLIEDRLHWIRSPGTGLVVASCGADATRVSFSF
jgi:predicted transposase YbfD/YdcC